MAGKIKYMAPIDNASGKIFGKAEKFTSVTRSFGNKQRGCAFAGKRNYTLHPITEDETAQRELFSQSAALRKKVLKDQGLKATWLGRFQADLKANATNCCTLSGYVMSQAMHGHVDAQGQYQE